MNIIKYPNDTLRNVSIKIEKDEIEVFNTLKEMRSYIKEDQNNAAGLALSQVGINKRGFVMNTNDGKQLIVMNPSFIKKGKLYIPSFQEGCLSIDEDKKNVLRHKTVRMRYYDLNWNAKLVDLVGFEAVVAQHEYDHLEGILYIDKAVN